MIIQRHVNLKRTIVDGIHLHSACYNSNVSISVIQLLITKYPKACQEKTNNGWLPLHFACWFNQSLSVIQLLINKYPKACQEKSTTGWLPLHYACRSNQSLSVIQLLASEWPDAFIYNQQLQIKHHWIMPRIPVTTTTIRI